MKRLLFCITLIGLLFTSCDKEDPVNHQLATLTTTQPYDIGAETAISGGNITNDGGTPVTARGVCWNTSPQPTVSHDKTQDGNGAGDFVSNMTGLTAGETYYVRAYATNQAGTAYGNEEVFISNLPNSFTDQRDGNTYRTVTIGTQTWMAENLRFLPEVHSNEEFDRRSTPGYGVYGYNGSDVTEAKQHPNYDDYGVIYNWMAASNACPAGWHLSSADEWDELENYIKNDGIVQPGLEGNTLKATYGWNCGLPGTDDYGFTALAAGLRSDKGLFFDEGLYSNWWTSTEANFDNGAGYRALVCSYGLFDKGATLKFAGYYVRCIKD